MSGRLKRAKRALVCPLGGRVRRHLKLGTGGGADGLFVFQEAICELMLSAHRASSLILAGYFPVLRSEIFVVGSI